MEFHKSLYKSINFDNKSPKNKLKTNLKNGRQSKRIERFQENRILIVSPAQAENKNISTKINVFAPSENDMCNKENTVEPFKKDSSTSRREAFVAKFIAWKKQKDIERSQKVPTKAPFISACSGNILFSNPQNSFAPQARNFKPPANLIHPSAPENCKYVVRNLVPDKPKIFATEKLHSAKGKDFITANKQSASTPKLLNKPKQVSKTDPVRLKEKKNTPLLTSAKRITKLKYETKNHNELSNKKLNNIKNTVSTEKNGITENVGKSNAGAFVKIRKQNTPSSENIRNRAKIANNRFKIPSDIKNNQKSVKDSALTKKSVLIKSPIKEVKELPKKPFLVQKTPHKKPTYLKRETKINTKNINSNNAKSNLKKENDVKSKMEAPKLLYFEKPEIIMCQETPIEKVEMQNSSFYTSTQRKSPNSNSCSNLSTELNKIGISIIEAEEKEKVKKNLIPLVNLFSERKSLALNNMENEIFAAPLNISKSPILDKTPTDVKINNEEEPITYTSPYVTISRGKGSGKKEKKLRESVYISKEDGIESAEMRRTRETVRYFRKMLNDEIDRLLNRCNEWEQYVKNTDPIILEDCGGDMINVAIGQTKLLTSKKFNQFKSLIEQCEQFAEIKFSLKKADDKTGKPILPEDLEGFWQMMYIQVDDIDERFRKLECWRSNNWKDPDEIQPQEQIKKKNNKLLTKVSKKKNVQSANPNLRKKLKDMYLAFMENKKQELENNENDIIIVTPSKKSKKSINLNENNSTLTPLRRSRRISSAKENIPQIVTPSRKSLRIETVINAASKLYESNATNGTPKNGISDFRLISLVKTPCIGCPGNMSCSPKPRKSILKTPGTLKKRQTVVFNEQLQFKSPNNSFDSESKKRRRSSSAKGSVNKSLEKTGNRRSLNLRARRLVLDAEAKIEIPRKK